MSAELVAVNGADHRSAEGGAARHYLDRLMITTMRDPIRADVHVTDAQFGLFTSVFLWVYAAASPFGGFVADRVGRRGIILASLLVWSIATCLSGFAHSSNLKSVPTAGVEVSNLPKNPGHINWTGVKIGASS